MSFSDILARLDRRFVFLAIMLVVLVPYVHPIGLPIRVSRESEAFFAAIEQVPEGSTVLLSADFDPGSMPELLPMTQAALEQCFRRNLKVVGMCLWPAGPPLLDRAFAVVAPKYDKVYGKDYVNLGFKQGQEAVMVRVGASIPETFPADYAGRPVGQFEVMRGVQNLSNVNILINISAGYPGTKEWVQQVGQRFPECPGPADADRVGLHRGQRPRVLRLREHRTAQGTPRRARGGGGIRGPRAREGDRHPRHGRAIVGPPGDHLLHPPRQRPPALHPAGKPCCLIRSSSPSTGSSPSPS